MEKHSHLFFYHFLIVLKRTFKPDFYDKTLEEVDQNLDLDYYLNKFLIEQSINSKSGNYLFADENEKLEFFITSQAFPYGITDLRQIDFYIAIYSELRLKHPAYQPLVFFKLIFEFIEFTKRFFFEPLKILEAIKARRADANDEEGYIESNLLFYWLLLAIKNQIGFDGWGKTYPDINIGFELLYKFLDVEAKILDCSPSDNLSVLTFSNNKIHSKLPSLLEVEERTFQLTDKLKKTDLARIFDTIYEGGYIEKKGITKEKFLVQVGLLFNEDLSDFGNFIRANGNADFDYSKIFLKLRTDCQNLFKKRIEENTKKR